MMLGLYNLEILLLDLQVILIDFELANNAKEI